jgi:hypothetical protein
MRPALKFLKHAPRGLKQVKGTGLVEEIAKLEMNPTVGRVEEGVKRVTPLKFKNLRIS